MPVTVDPVLALLSLAVAVLGVTSALGLAAQSRNGGLPTGHTQIALLNGALTMGIVAWATHFIAARAIGFPVSAGTGVVETAASIASTVVASWIGLSLAATRRLWGIGVPIGGLVVGAALIGLHYRPVWYAAACGAECNSQIMLACVGSVVLIAMTAVWVAFYKPSTLRIVICGPALGLAVALISYAAMVGTYAVRPTSSADWSIPQLLDLPASYAIAAGVAVLVIANIALLTQITKFRLTRERVTIVQWTYHRVEEAGVQVADLFYDRLFEIAPDTRKLFAADLSKQKDKLLDVLASAVLHLHDLNTVMEVIKDLGRRHVYYGVTSEHYTLVGQALMWTLERVLGDDFTPATRRAWNAAYKTLANAMLDAAKEVRPLERRRIRETAPANPGAQGGLTAP